MATYRTVVESPLTPEEAFDYLADFENVTKWDENTVSSDCLGDEPYQAGARYRVVTRFGSRTMTLTYETIEFERPGRVAFRSGTSMATIEDTITITPTGEGSRVEYVADIGLKGVSRLLDPVFSLIFKRVGDRAAEGLRVALDAG
ncbi:MAG: SRPBCC family protein [Solirubrobacterales bacterium]